MARTATGPPWSEVRAHAIGWMVAVLAIVAIWVDSPVLSRVVLGACAGFFVVLAIASRRRRADAVAFQQRFADLVHTIEGMPALAWTMHADGGTSFVSRRWLEYTGLSAEESERSRLWTVVHPDDRERAVASWHVAVAGGGPFESEVRFRRADGEYRWFLVRAVALRDDRGSIAKWCGVAADIEDRRRAEQALKRAEFYLADAQRLTHTGSWARGFGSEKYSWWSEETFRILGYDPRGPIPDLGELRGRVHPDDRARVVKERETAYRDRTDFENDYRFILADGTVKHIYVFGHLVVDEATGAGVEYVGTLIDVTERKRIEEERERIHRLQAELARVTRISTMGELTASLAHEVNQPIAAAMIDADACARWLNRAEPNLEKARTAAAQVVNHTTRAAEIVGRIRSLFRKGRSERERMDLNEVIGAMIALVRQEAIRHRVSIRTQLAKVPPVAGDRVQLQQVLLNLLINAIEATKDMEGAREIVVASRCDGDRPLVAVTDTGVGLPPGPERIFDAFFTTKPDGTGMGLAISRSIVESHGGRLWATANEGRGATFCFSLPPADELRSAAATEVERQT